MKVLFLDFSTKLTSLNDLKIRGRGGMVSSLFSVPDELTRLGFDCAVLSDVQVGGHTFAGTKWFTIDDYPANSQWDVLVCNRGIGNGYQQIRAKKRVLWTHDLPHNGFALEPQMLKGFALTVFMSKYAEAVWRTFFKDIGKSVLIPNGVDKSLFKPCEKDRGRLIFISAPNRGLKRLPLIFDAIKSRTDVPVSMVAYSNLKSLHPNEVKEEDEDTFELDYKECSEAGIDLRNPVAQHKLAPELGKAGLMVVPTDYPEICSNSILQALSCGTPIITTGNLGATPEWVRHGWNGMLTKYAPRDYMVHTVEMVRNAVEVLNNERLHKKLISNAPKTSNLFSWQQIGKKWAKALKGIS